MKSHQGETALDQGSGRLGGVAVPPIVWRNLISNIRLPIAVRFATDTAVANQQTSLSQNY